MTFARVNDLEADFWKQNPQIALMTPFNKFKKVKNSSKVMTAIYLIHDPQSTFRRSGMSTDEILSDINKNFLNDDKYKWDDYIEIIEAYKDKCTSRLAKKVEAMLDEIDEIEEARSALTWDDPLDADLKIKLFDSSKKLYKEAIELQNLLNEELAELQIQGDYVPSLIEEFSLG